MCFQPQRAAAQRAVANQLDPQYDLANFVNVDDGRLIDEEHLVPAKKDNKKKVYGIALLVNNLYVIFKKLFANTKDYFLPLILYNPLKTALKRDFLHELIL